MKREIGAIILAAGRGKRMQSVDRNKVTMPLSGKPIILHIVHFFRSVGIENIVVVIGFAKESVKEALGTENVLFAEQTDQLGTGHAVEVALPVLPEQISDVLVVYGDDGVFYNEKQRSVIEQLFEKHFEKEAVCSFVTIEQENPAGLGRIIRKTDGSLSAIIEEKDATDEEKLLTEINPGCFVFSVEFLKKYLPLIEKSSVTGEYYLTSLVDLALKHGERVETVRGGKLLWRGVNTPDELSEAERLYNQSQ